VLDGFGRNAWVHIQDFQDSTRNQAVSFTSNAAGQVLLRTKSSNNSTNPVDRHHYLSQLCRPRIQPKLR
jgi:hypothetical protein